MTAQLNLASEVDKKGVIFKNPLYHLEELPLFVPSSNDLWSQSAVSANLSEIAYYAALGMPKKKIGALIGRPLLDPEMTRFFEIGQALYELGLRHILLQNAKKNPQIAAALLNRSAGSPEDEANSSLSPEEQKLRFGRVKYGQ